jgi:hypothetical protein
MTAERSEDAMAVMHRLAGVALLATLLALPAENPVGAAQEPAPLVLEAVIPLGNVTGRLDHMAIDPSRRRLFLAELGNDSLAVVDLADRKLLHRVTGLKEPQGVAYLPATDLVAVAGAGDGALLFLDARDFAPLGRLGLGNDADNLHVDGTTGHLVAGYGEGGLAVIDPKSRAKLAEIPLGAHPEGFRLSADGRHAFVNLPDARRIAVIDMTAGREVASWPLGDLRSNFPLALRGDDRLVAIAFRTPPTLALLDSGDGHLLARLPSCNDADDVFFDERRQRIYLSCGEGAVEVFARGKDGALQRLARIETSEGARTSLFVPELDRLYVAARAGGIGGEARILVFRPQP